MIKKFLFILSYSLYLAFLLGLILHTSAHPQIFHKYTIKYAIVLIALIVGFVPFLWGARFLNVKTTLKFNKKKIILSPRVKIVACVLIVLLIFAVSEIFLRYKFRNYESDSYTYTIDNFNPFLQSQIAKQEGLTVNSLGFRGGEISAQKPNGTYRIVVLGGSTVLNREVPFEENAVRVLEKMLRSHYPNKKIEVINAGKDFYTSEHSLIQYMFKISDLNPDLIIMWHGANDESMSCPIEGVISHGSYKPDYSYYYGAVAKIVFDYFKPQPIIQIKFVTLDFLLKAMGDNLYSDITNRFEEASRQFAAKEYMLNKNTVSVRNFPSIDAYKRNLEYLIELTRDKGTPLILGNQPNLYKQSYTLQEVEKIMYPTVACRANGKNYDLASLKYGIDLFNQATEQVARENNTMYIDLERQVPKNLTYFLDSIHYTEKGDGQIANTLYNYILSKQLIPTN